MVKNLLKKVKGVNEDDLENVTSEIEHLTEGFTKVIGFSSKLFLLLFFLILYNVFKLIN